MNSARIPFKRPLQTIVARAFWMVTPGPESKLSSMGLFLGDSAGIGFAHPFPCHGPV